MRKRDHESLTGELCCWICDNVVCEGNVEVRVLLREMRTRKFDKEIMCLNLPLEKVKTEFLWLAGN